ncbi:MAG: hypothetical protein H6Q05_1263 [Acidobacteria bacterium]|nr:hypothetical protein [Acidobacteriota bacterium]
MVADFTPQRNQFLSEHGLQPVRFNTSELTRREKQRDLECAGQSPRSPSASTFREKALDKSYV